MVLRTGTNVPLEPLFLPIGTKRSTTLGSYFSRDNQMGRMPPSLVVSENVMRKSEKVTHSICYLLLVADLQGLLLLIRSEMHPLRNVPLHLGSAYASLHSYLSLNGIGTHKAHSLI